MALQISYQSAMGFTAPTAYAHITSYSGNKNTIQCNVDVFYDAATKDTSIPIGSLVISLPLADGATMEQMYQALKQDGNFTGAIDC